MTERSGAPSLPPLTVELVEEIRHYGTHIIGYEKRAETVIALCDLALKSLRSETATPNKALYTALTDLLDQVDSLDDYTLTRDIEKYKAEAIWDDALDRARIALKNAAPQATASPSESPGALNGPAESASRCVGFTPSATALTDRTRNDVRRRSP